MLKRSLNLPKNHSFFLFGARNTGKTTLLRSIFRPDESLLIDLLNPEEEDRFIKNPSDLEAMILAQSSSMRFVVIDEVQKVPKLLDVVHSLIERTDKIFIMSGSSARKLKYGGANLLAGRAFVYSLFPFTSLELGSKFSLEQSLQFGLLPAIQEYSSNDERIKFLQAYSHTYLKEEIIAEQLIRKVNPFRRFLEVAAQCNGKIINFSSIARDVGVDYKTVEQYFSILEDTLIGFHLEPFQHSFRKRLSQKPKFYFFDTGVTRSLSRSLSVPLIESTSAYGEAFEHFIILECIKNASYFYTDFRFSYLRTKDDAEVDLVVERPGQPLLLLEIKSSISVKKEDLTTLAKLSKDFGACEVICFSRDPLPKQFDDIRVLPWQIGVKEYFVKID